MPLAKTSPEKRTAPAYKQWVGRRAETTPHASPVLCRGQTMCCRSRKQDKGQQAARHKQQRRVNNMVAGGFLRVGSDKSLDVHICQRQWFPCCDLLVALWYRPQRCSVGSRSTAREEAEHPHSREQGCYVGKGCTYITSCGQLDSIW